jgi:hypothetical protein
LKNHYATIETQPNFRRAAVIGAAIAFLNFPGYLAVAIVHPPRVALLFLVAGATCGLWVGWHAWRATHLDAPRWPRFSLKTLWLLAMAWGALLVIFAPMGAP